MQSELRAVGEEVGGNQERDEEEHEPRVHRQVEPLRPREEPAVDGHGHADEDENLEDVLGQGVEVSRAPGEEVEAGQEPLDDERDGPDGQDDEAAEEEDVEDAGVEVAEHSLLREAVLERPADSEADPVETRLGRSREQHADAPARGVHEHNDR